MFSTSQEPVAAEQVKAILLGYLEHRAGHLWPGGDGLTLDEMIRSYPQAMRARLVPDLSELRRRVPDLDAALAEWFDAIRGSQS